MPKTDIEISHEVAPEKIGVIAEKAGIPEEALEYYGPYKAKVSQEFIRSLEGKKDGKLILVTAITPTKAGEGKTTTTVGLADGLSRIGKKVMGCLREPSLGPVFGVKGGATGGGYAQVVPMEDINLHFTGDLHAITAANNLISAALDNSLYQGNPLRIDPERVLWKRAMDMNDRALRRIVVGIGEKNGVERNDGFNITVASEIMAILCLSKDFKDFNRRVNEIVLAFNEDGEPVTVKGLGVGGAVTALMLDALKPNLVQSLEHTPFFIHGGPFANIAHGCNSVIATTTALKLADYVVTEAGFGADLGCEKFCDIKCRAAGIRPDAIVLVVTVRALKLHGGVPFADLKEENVPAVEKGFENVVKHADTLSKIGVPFVLALNRFYLDTGEERDTVLRLAKEHGFPIVIANGWEKGGRGMTELAEKVVELTDSPNHFRYIYEESDSFEEKLQKIVREVYGGKDVVFTESAQAQLETFRKFGWDKLPVCVAKTQSSLTDNAKILGAPKDFTVTVRELRISKGAGFVVVLTGSVMTMPGLPKVPAANLIGVNDDGTIYGLF